MIFVRQLGRPFRAHSPFCARGQGFALGWGWVALSGRGAVQLPGHVRYPVQLGNEGKQ